ncbi:MAG: HlyC/CorC family transporter [Victivallales bacterium]|nr:HlyC/CorC family transporter [Victivallales bacterium]
MISPILLAYIILLVLLLALVGFFSGTETAVTSVNRLAIDEKVEKKDKNATIIKWFITNFDRFLSTVLTGTNLVHISLVTIAGVVIQNHLIPFLLPNLPASWHETVSAVILTPIILVFGEILPKSIARRRAEAFSLRAAGLLQFFNFILTPLVVTLTWLSNRVQSMLGLSTSHDDKSNNVTREDLETIAELAAEQELVPQNSADMLQMVLELDEKPVANAMTPLVDVCSLPASASVGDVEKMTMETGYSRFPVYNDRVDNIIGVIELRRLIKIEKQRNLDAETFRNQPILPFIDKSVLFVPESKPVNQMLAELRKHAIPMAVIVDEYGGMIGLVTIEDLAQQIIGSIQDYGEEDEQPVHKSPNEMICDGRTAIREIEDFFDIEIDNEGFETVAGLILKLAGHIPKGGEFFKSPPLKLTVLQTEQHRISKVKIVKIPT